MKDVVTITIAHAAKLKAVPRDLACTKTAFCLVRRGHKGPCLEVARAEYTAPDFGPAAATRPRRRQP